jgi:hypothetical protein
MIWPSLIIQQPEEQAERFLDHQSLKIGPWRSRSSFSQTTIQSIVSHARHALRPGTPK